MTYILRLFDDLLAHGHAEFTAARRSLWRWIKEHQIPSAAGDGALFAQFFEDHDTPTNRTAWAPLNLARYLLEHRENAAILNGAPTAGTLIEFVRREFHASGIRHHSFVTSRTRIRQAWGGINSTYGAVLALYAKAIGSAALAAEARRSAGFHPVFDRRRGRPRDVFTKPVPGGWQEDAHTDVIHNYVDALRAFPEWGEAR